MIKKNFYSTVTRENYPTEQQAAFAENVCYQDTLKRGQMVRRIMDKFDELRAEHDAEIQAVQDKYEPLFDEIVAKLNAAGVTELNESELLDIIAKHKILPNAECESNCQCNSDCADCHYCESDDCDCEDCNCDECDCECSSEECDCDESDEPLPDIQPIGVVLAVRRGRGMLVKPVRVKAVRKKEQDDSEEYDPCKDCPDKDTCDESSAKLSDTDEVSE